ncbi:MAG: caspase family protein [Fimbriimonadaceae bacterium]|nr:caspase family protein [Fimbriimonadaceae bacterium]
MKYAAADANEVGAAFRASGVAPRNVVVLTSDTAQADRQGTRANFLRALSGVRERAVAGDKVVVFFAGHGIAKEGQQYLLPSDTQADLFEETALAVRTVNKALEGTQAAELLFLLDACRNDPTAGRGDNDAALTDGLARGLRPILAKPVDRPAVVATLLACDVGQRAYEDPEAGHGAFTVYLPPARGGQATAGGPVKLSALASYVNKEVTAWGGRSRKEQRPRLENPDGGDMLILTPPPEPLVSVAFVNHTLAQVVDLVSQQYGAAIVLGKGVDPTLSVTGRLENQPLGTVLKVLVAAHDRTVRKQAGVFLIESAGAGDPARPDQPPTGPADLPVAADGPGDCRAIMEAVNRVGPGSTIRIKAGVYRESVVLQKPVSLVGDGDREQVVMEQVGQTVLTVSGESVTIRRLTLRQLAPPGDPAPPAEGTDWRAAYPTRVSSQAVVTATDCRFTTNRRVYHASQVKKGVRHAN